MYISDVEEGGCTVFPQVDSPTPTEPTQHSLDMFDKRSLEYNMVLECNRKLVVPPQQGTAALFYSITPDGRVDPRAMHGACPVIKGVKWGANIWIWNRQRFGEIKTGEPRSLRVRNEFNEQVYIEWESRDNGSLPPRGEFKMDTFEFHRFRAHVGSHSGEIVDEFTVQSEPQHQEWVIKPKRTLDDSFDGISSRMGGSDAHSEF